MESTDIHQYDSQISKQILALPLNDDILNSISPEGVMTITFNRPTKFNALTYPMNIELIRLLQLANSDPKVKVVVLRGAGKHFSAGAGLDNYVALPEFFTPEKLKYLVHWEAHNLAKVLVNAFLSLRKPIMAVVQGIAIGISMTLLGLCDFVYAFEDAQFQAPFVQLGLDPEILSGYTFTKIMGKSMASEVLLTCRKFSAEEAFKFNFVSKLLKKGAEGEETVKEAILKLASMPSDCLVDCKRLMNDEKEIEYLKQRNEKEIAELIKKINSPFFLKNVMKFNDSRKPKL